METKIIKSKKRVNWKFPCKGISKTDGTIVGFSGYRIGIVLDIGKSKYLKLYDIADNWNMDNFTPIKEEKQLVKDTELTQEVDWDNITLPIWAKNPDGNITLIYKIYEKRVDYLIISGNYIRFTNERTFCCISDRNEWLNSLEILPNGTKIEITI